MNYSNSFRYVNPWRSTRGAPTHYTADTDDLSDYKGFKIHRLLGSARLILNGHAVTHTGTVKGCKSVADQLLGLKPQSPLVAGWTVKFYRNAKKGIV